MKILNKVCNSFIKTIGRILAYLLVGAAIALLCTKCAKAQSYTAIDTVLPDTYYNYFSGVVSKLPINEKYKSFTYECYSGSYTRNCYYLAYGKNYENYIRFYRYDNASGYTLEKGVDRSFSVNGNLIYSSELGFSSSLDKGGNANVQTSILIGIIVIFLWLVFSRLIRR